MGTSTCSRGIRWKLLDLGSALDEGSTGQGASSCSRPWESEFWVKAEGKGTYAGHGTVSILLRARRHRQLPLASFEKIM